MSYQNDRVVIHDLETGRGRRLAILAAALVAVVLVIWTVATGFHGGLMKRNAAAIAQPVETQAQPVR
jgi:hypothetical protein